MHAPVPSRARYRPELHAWKCVRVAHAEPLARAIREELSALNRIGQSLTIREEQESLLGICFRARRSHVNTITPPHIGMRSFGIGILTMELAESSRIVFNGSRAQGSLRTGRRAA